MTKIAENRRARFEYEILETYEAGIVLLGHEVKSVKIGHVQLGGSYATVKNNEIWLLNCDIPPYQPKNTPLDYDTKRSRRLLFHAKEIAYLIGKIKEQKLTLIPLEMYNTRGKIKLMIGLGKGKKTRDKRDAIKKRDAEREIAHGER